MNEFFQAESDRQAAVSLNSFTDYVQNLCYTQSRQKNYQSLCH